MEGLVRKDLIRITGYAHNIMQDEEREKRREKKHKKHDRESEVLLLFIQLVQYQDLIRSARRRKKTRRRKDPRKTKICDK